MLGDIFETLHGDSFKEALSIYIHISFDDGAFKFTGVKKYSVFYFAFVFNVSHLSTHMLYLLVTTDGI